MVSSVVISIGTALVLCGITVVVLFGDLPSFKGSIVAKSRWWLLSVCWPAVLKTAAKIDQRFCKGILHEVFVRRLYRAYFWLPPVFYAVLFTTLVAQFYTYAYPKISQPRSMLIAVSLVTNAVAFVMGIITDPGDCTEVTNFRTRFPYNELIFFDHSLYGHGSKNHCRTCKTLKIPRSKHCSVCGRCIALFDHHCIWLNQCVGYYNYKYFLTFLVSLVWIFSYGSYLNYRVLADQKTGSMSWFDLIAHTGLSNERTGIVLVICALLLPVVAWFTAEHIQFVYLGMTTNESSKWDFVRFLISNGFLFRYDGLYLVQDSDGTFYRLSDDDIRFPLNPTAPAPVKITDMSQQLENIYDLGFYNNLKQRLITPSL